LKSQSLTVLLVAMLGVASEQPRNTLIEVTATSARYESLQNEALRFFRAVRNRDIPTLVRLSPPASRAAVRKDLDNPMSPLSRLLMTGSHAMRGRFMSVQTPRLTLLRQSDVPADDQLVVCFSDPRQPFEAPVSNARLPALESNRAELCLPFAYSDRHWQFVASVR
jgi:hypothetical protein